MSKRVASLSGSALRLEALREEGRAELIDLLESLPGTKCLVLESHIGGLLNHVIPEGSKASPVRGSVTENGISSIVFDRSDSYH